MQRGARKQSSCDLKCFHVFVANCLDHFQYNYLILTNKCFSAKKIKWKKRRKAFN